MRRCVVNKKGNYFITFTCNRWLPLIELTKSYDLVYKWFHVITAKGYAILGYVIMPNHLHLILYYPGSARLLNTVVGNGKRFIAYGIVQRLKNMGEQKLLKGLELDVTGSDRSRKKLHDIWIKSFDVKECRTESFLLQKLHYIHKNPCVGKWKLAKFPHLYPHSSALFYFNGKPGLFPVQDYRKFFL